MRQPTKHYEFGPFRLDATERLLLRDGMHVPLTPKAFDLLLALVESHGHILGKEELIERIWPDTFVEENNLTKNISALRKLLSEADAAQEFIETIPKRGYRFVARVREMRNDGASLLVAERTRVRIITEEDVADDQADLPTLLPSAELEPVGGAVPLDSQFYIVRPTDAEFHAAITRQDSLVLVKGARQVGKTSLLARGLQQARQAGARVVLTDFQMLNAADLQSVETLFLMLAELIADRLELEVLPRTVWDPLYSPNFNFERYWRREVLGKISAPILWGLDEVDRLFTCPFASEVFGLFRSWHNARSLEPEGPWRRLTMAMAYATEAHLFIADLNQSPFNVGTRLQLEDFTIEQVAELNRRYGSPLPESVAVQRYFHLVGGNPYLVRRGLHHLTMQGTELSVFEAQADSDEGPFSDHLRRMLASLTQDPALCEVVRGVLRGQPCPTAESFYRLRSAGVISGDSAREVKLRCQLYTVYLARHLL